MHWTEEQLQAIMEDGKNIIVSAGAGSGKTAVLSERVLRKVKDGVAIDQLLILTFTNAAAKEMKERIRKKLVQNHLEEELLRLDKAYITTFDAFALATVKKYHETLNISRDIAICDSFFLDLKIEKILENIFDEYYQSENVEFENFVLNFCTKDDKNLQKAILNLYKRLEMRYDMHTYLKEYMDSYYQDHYICHKCGEYVDLLRRKIAKVADVLKELSLALDTSEFFKYDAIVQFVNASSYDEMASLFTTSLPRVNKNYEEEARMLKDKLAAMLKDLKSYFIYESEKQMKDELLSTKSSLSFLITILQELERRVTYCKKEEGLYTFTDVFKLAIELVEQHPAVRESLSNSFNEIMIDEYQDNNDLQEIFISYISHHNVYMVGDIKQSIYRFRNANPNIFKEKYDLYSLKEEGVKIDLNRNFRSRLEVLDDINLLFNGLMDLEIGGADYQKSHQMIFGNKSYIEEGKTEENYHLDVIQYTVSEEKNISKEEQEIFIICQDIIEKVKHKFPIFDKSTKMIRPIQYSDIVILLDKSKYFNLYKRIFEYFQIPLSVYKDESLKNNTDIFMINHLLKLAIKMKEETYDTDFKYSFLAVARSYLFSIPDDEIFAYFKNQNFLESIICSKLSSLISYLDTESPLSFYHLLLDTFEVEEKLITTDNIRSSRIRLEYFYNMLKQLMEKGYSIYDFCNYLDTLYEGDYDIRFSLNFEEENSCKIMTIHKSKGLEFPVCYFASFPSKFNLRDLNEKILYDEDYQIVLPSFLEGEKPTIYKQLLKDKNLKEEIGEKIRLLYVALTRSCEKMIIVMPEKEVGVKAKEEYRCFADMIYAAADSLSGYIKKVDSVVTKDYLRQKDADKLTVSLDSPFMVEEITTSGELIEKGRYSKSSSSTSKEVQTLLEMGIKVHQVLELLDFKNPDYTGVDAIILEKVKRFLATDIIQKNQDSKFYHEYEFLFQKNGVLRHGVIDLLIENDRELIIVDYKLKNIDDEKYVFQLNGYKEALSLRTDKSISCYLYSIVDGKLLQI